MNSEKRLKYLKKHKFLQKIFKFFKFCAEIFKFFNMGDLGKRTILKETKVGARWKTKEIKEINLLVLSHGSTRILCISG